MRIYVVMGTTGEYSDRHEWPVKAFDDESKAQSFIVEVTKIAKEIEVTRETRYSSPKNSNPLDPNMKMDYTGTDYFYYTTTLDA